MAAIDDDPRTTLGRIANALERANELEELKYLRAHTVDCDNTPAMGRRKTELAAKLWPSGIRAEHQRNPMTHVSRLRRPPQPVPGPLDP